MPASNGHHRPRRLAALQRVTGVLLMVMSATMLPPLAVNLIYHEGVARPFLMGLWITLASGALLWWPVRGAQVELKVRDGFLITVGFWTILSLFGAIPLYSAGLAWHSWSEAVFESVSGLTTTGATTVASGIDQLPHALNFYRAQLQWLGGMGIIVLAVAILPMLGIGGMQLYKAETPGPMKDAKLTPRITGTARALWSVYVTLTVACGVCYWLLGMNAFDAICHAFSTLATGGFSTHDANIGWFNNMGIELACVFFMLAGASNFALHWHAWEDRSVRGYLGDTEFRTFCTLILGMGLLVCTPLYLSGLYDGIGETLRHGLFQLAAYATASGFRTADPTGWPVYVPMLLVLSTFMVCCAGGTGGGVKVVRLILFVKQAMRELLRLVHPNAEIAIKLDGKVVSNDIVYAIGGFFSVYIGFTVLLTFALMATGLDSVTALSAVAACINNAGPGLGLVHSSMASVSDPGKWVLIFAMLLGRLEVFTLLVIFTPAFWRR